MKKIKISSGAPWEDLVGYSRAVKADNLIEVTGTVAIKDGKVVGKDDPYKQAICILDMIENQLKRLDASLEDVIRTRIFVTDIKTWKEVGKAHGEVFGTIKPATTMVEVSALISPEYLVEIEATAVVDEGDQR